MVSRFTSFMSTVGIFSLILNVGSLFGGSGEAVPWLAVLVLIAAPSVGGLLQLALSRTREFDADLGAATLTGDPDGLASALTRLEKVQGRLWESVVLPGGRTPNPSVLRTHPLTADRVRRLMELKRSGAVPTDGTDDNGSAGRTLRPRPSLVPRVPRTDGRYLPPSNVPGIAALVGDPPGDDASPSGDDGGPSSDSRMPVEGSPRLIDDNLPACDGPLNPPDGNPRLRVMRGGVWW
jgi:heat shock protein HtpX